MTLILKPLSFKNWRQRAYLDAKGANLPIGYATQTTYWLLDNNFLVGIGRIKHFLTPQLTTRTGHIAYAVPKTKCR